jgi:hypothetical protein
VTSEPNLVRTAPILLPDYNVSENAELLIAHQKELAAQKSASGAAIHYRRAGAPCEHQRARR